MMRRTRLHGVIAILLVFSSGCAGRGSFGLSAEGALRGPVSMTGTVLAPDGRPIQIGEHLEEIGRFEERKRFWGLFTIGLNASDWDVTKLANEAMAASGGEAIVNLSIEAESCRYMGLAIFVPIVPSYVDLTIRGDIARRIPANGSFGPP